MTGQSSGLVFSDDGLPESGSTDTLYIEKTTLYR